MLLVNHLKTIREERKVDKALQILLCTLKYVSVFSISSKSLEIKLFKFYSKFSLNSKFFENSQKTIYKTFTLSNFFRIFHSYFKRQDLKKIVFIAVSVRFLDKYNCISMIEYNYIILVIQYIKFVLC